MKNKIVPALDVGREQAFELVEKLETVKNELAGYKVGSLLVMKNSIDVLKELKEVTDVPIIYDGQKLGTDIPDIVRKQVQLLAETEIDQLIIAPQGSGSETLTAFTDACKDYDIEPICVVLMTQPKADAFLGLNSHISVFSAARYCGIKKYVFPATRPEIFADVSINKDDIIMATGFKVQGGKVELLRKLGVREFIVGRGIYQAEDPTQAVRDISKEINK